MSLYLVHKNVKVYVAIDDPTGPSWKTYTTTKDTLFEERYGYRDSLAYRGPFGLKSEIYSKDGWLMNVRDTDIREVMRGNLAREWEYFNGPKGR